MSKLTREDILKLARLARLDVSEEEVSEYSAELSAILDYVEMLSEVDVTGLEPTSQVTGLENVTRPDEIRHYGYEAEDLLKNVPAVQDHQIKTRRIIE
jgi:aspartyl-tRNA(Asn)/glutamyl-tRNA(Gln) amidotransferase subunit C